MTGAPIPLARPDVGAGEEQLVLEVMRSGRLSLGPMLERFEREFAAWIGSEGAVAVSSGTAALHLGVRALGWTRGDEVVTSPFSFVASANCLLYEDVTPVFCDIDPVTLNMDPQAAEAACGSRTVGVLPVHIFGYPADLESLGRTAAAQGLGVLEDACEALGAVDAQGVKLGARGSPAAFAFYANKQLTTGEGGMLTAGDASVRERVRSERNQGRAEDMDWLAHDRLGFNYRLSDIAAAIGVAQLARVEELLADAAPRRGLVRRAPERRSRGSSCPAPTPVSHAAAGSSTSFSSRSGSTATASSGRSPSAGSPPRPISRASTSSRFTGSASATAAVSSRWPSRSRPGRWRCPSSRA